MSYRRDGSSRDKYIYIGVDTHKYTHTGCILSSSNEPLGFVETENHPSSFGKFLKNLKRLAPKGATCVFGLEDTQGLGRSLARFLLDEGFTVKEINPVKSKRERRLNPHPDKSDPDDAMAVAKVLRDEFHLLPSASFEEWRSIMRDILQYRSHLVQIRTQLKNKLHRLLHYEYPGYTKFFSSPFEPRALAFWKRYPTPSHLASIGSVRLGRLLAKFFKKEKASLRAREILKLIPKKPPASNLSDARSEIIRAIVEKIESLNDEIDTQVDKLKPLVEEYGGYLLTMPGIAVVSAAELLVRIGDIRRFSSSAKLARFSGIAPAKSGSAKRIRFKKSHHGRRSLNTVFYLIGLSQIAKKRDGKYRNQAARDYFNRKVKEGKSPKEALTCLDRRLVDIVYAMMRDRAPYKLSKSKRRKQRSK